MKTRSAATKKHDQSDSSDSEDEKIPVKPPSDNEDGSLRSSKKRKQSKSIGKEKSLVDLELIKNEPSSESDNESLSPAHSIKNSDSENSNNSLSESDSDEEGSKKLERHKRTDEYKEGPKFTKGQIKDLINSSDFKDILEIKSEPSSCQKNLKKLIVTFDSVFIISKDKKKELSKGMTVKLEKYDKIGKMRQISEIELEITDQKLTKVLVQTDVFVTKKELESSEKIVKEESDSENEKNTIKPRELLKQIKNAIEQHHVMEDREIIKLVETNILQSSVPLSQFYENMSLWENVQLCRSSKEAKMKEKMNKDEEAYFCTREFDLKTKQMALMHDVKEEEKDSDSENSDKHVGSENNSENESENESDKSGSEENMEEENEEPEVHEETKSRGRQKGRKKSRSRSKAKSIKSKRDQMKEALERDAEHDEEKKSEKKQAPISEEKQAMLSIYDEACKNLELNAVPEYLPCREKERSEIYEFIKSGIETSGSATSLYISGMPGTGKTATVLEVINRLRKDAKEGKIPNFEFIDINGMGIGSIYMVYVKIHKNLTGKTVSPCQAVLFLDKFFKRKKVDMKGAQKPEVVRIILMDELDGLFTKKQDLLYNLFDWPSYAQARLVIIGIANTMNLPEELQAKIASRMCCKRIVYEPYNKEQIQTILDTRISKLKLFEQDAVRYVSMKVAALSGDMRRCLQISKRAVEIARNAYLDSTSTEPLKINIDHLISAANELFNSKITALIRCLTDYELLMLTALVLERTNTKTDVIKRKRLFDRFEAVITKVKASPLRDKEMEYLVVKLGEFGLVSSDETRSKTQTSDNLAVHVFNDELITALGDKPDYAILIELIQDAF